MFVFIGLFSNYLIPSLLNLARELSNIFVL